MKFNVLIYIIFCCILIPLSQASQNIITNTNSDGNVFYENEKIRIKVSTKNQNNIPSKIEYKIYDVKNYLVFKPEVIPVLTYDKNTTEVLSFELPKLNVGYWTIGISSLYNSNDIEENFEKIAIIRKSEIDTTTNSPFAIDAFLSWRLDTQSDINLASNLIKKAGINWIRDRIDWEHVQTMPEKYDFSRYKESQNIQHNTGLNILQVFHGTSPFASEQKEGDGEFRKKFPPNDLFYLYNYLKNSTEVFSKYVQAWEIWNEFDIPVFFLGTADQYAEILKTSYISLKQNFPDKLVLFGSVTFGGGLIQWGDKSYIDDEGERYIEKVFENGCADYFDIFNVHHYGPVGGVIKKIQRCKTLLKKYNCNKPIWLTEIGSTATEKMSKNVISEEYNQAEYIVKAYTLALSEGVSKIFYFCFPLFIEHGSADWGIFEIYPDKWQPKPSYVALANMIYTLNNLKFSGYYQADDKNITALNFSNYFRSAIVAWASEGTTPTLEISLNNKSDIILRSLYGNDNLLSNTNNIKMKLTKEPVYILLSSKDTTTNNKTIIDKDSTWIQDLQTSKTSISKEIVLNLRTEPNILNYKTKDIKGRIGIYNFSKETITGEVVLTIEYKDSNKEVLKKQSDIEKFNKKFLEFNLSIDDEISKSIIESDKEIVLTALFNDSNSKLKSSPVKCYIKFEKPFEFVKSSLIKEHNKSASFSLRFKSTKDITGSASVNINKAPAGYIITSPLINKINLTGEEKIYDIPVKMFKTKDEPSSRKTIQYSISIDDFKQTYLDTLESGYINYQEIPITIDGRNDDWSTHTKNQISGVKQIAHGSETYEGWNDLSSLFSLVWDEKYLYIYAEVKDDYIMNQFPSENPWTGDAVELFLDCREENKLGSPNYDKNVYQAFFVPSDKTNPKPFFKVWQPADVAWDGVEYKFLKRRGFGYNFEAKIPWMSLNIKVPTNGMIIGFDLVLDDMDEKDFEHVQMFWRGSSNNWRDPSMFSKLQLKK